MDLSGLCLSPGFIHLSVGSQLRSHTGLGVNLCEEAVVSPASTPVAVIDRGRWRGILSSSCFFNPAVLRGRNTCGLAENCNKSLLLRECPMNTCQCAGLDFRQTHLTD
jgi:hypothetical protein